MKILTAAVVMGMTPVADAMAQETGTADALRALGAELEALRADQVERQRQIDELTRRLDVLQTGIGNAPVLGEEAQGEMRGRGLAPAPAPAPAGLAAASPVPAAEQSEIRGRGAAPPLQPAAAAAPAAQQAAAVQPPAAGQQGAATPDSAATAGADAAAGEEPVQREPARAQSVEAVTQAEQGIFGDALSFEYGVSYSHFDQARINLSGFLALDAIFLGRISIDETTGDVLTFDFSTRYRVTPRLQFDVNIPYLWRTSTFQSGGAGSAASGLIEVTRRTHGFADISAGASFRVLNETLSRPDVVVNGRVKAPTGRDSYGVPLVEVPGSSGNLKVPQRLGTGSGNWGASIGASVLKTVDPLVIFGNLSYFFNIPQDFDDINEAPGAQPGRVDPGDSLQYGAGAAFAVNERASLSMSFTQRFVLRTKLRGATGPYSTVIGSQANVASLNLGGTFAISPSASIIVNLGAGLTADTPDFSLGMRVPFTL